MTFKRSILVVLAAALAGVLWYFYAGSQTPTGQAPLVSITPQNFHELPEAFNAAAGAPRLLILLSPT